MTAWWKGVALVFERGLLENLRSKTFRIVTGILLLVSAAAVVLPQVLAQDGDVYKLATVGNAPKDVVAALDASGDAAKFDVEYVARDDAEGVRQAVRSGDATVGLADDTLYAAAKDAGTFPAVVAQAVVTLETSRRLTEAGLSPQQITELQSIRPPRQVTVGAVADEGRAGVGMAVGLVLYLAILFGGTAIATAVALEKSTRISEVLLAILRPSQILVGTVLAVGTVTLLQLLVLGAPFAVAVRVTDNIGLPPVAAGDIALAIVWFLLGFALYAFLYAASGALVDKVTEVNTATTPVTTMIIGGYLITIFIVMGDPQSGWSVLVSMFPITAPLAMPLRWASGEVPTYQLVVAMALTAATAIALVSLASTVYRRALLITGRRVRLREVIGRPAV
ncbi:MAG TPA: ABC transporter permease [Kribbella sp.]|nr:ABC transporter permease [Kribbella sp.]